jgi:hypothetical protein
MHKKQANDSGFLGGIVRWFKLAVPNPKPANIQIQIGVHLEEVNEMLAVLFPATKDEYAKAELSKLISAMTIYSNALKTQPDILDENPNALNNIEFLDSLADQTVTAAGIAYMKSYDFIGAIREVNTSNYSKFQNGLPVFNEHGKIAKGKDYKPPNLEPFI